VLPFLLSLLAALSTANLPEIELAPQNEVLRIAVTGDTGEGAERVAKGIAKVHGATPLAAIVLTGDNFYPCGPVSERDPRWKLATPLTRVGIPVFPVLGNHDFCGKADPDAQIRATKIIANWRFPARQYVIRSGVADFAFVDTTPLVRGRTHRVTPAIAAAFAKSEAPWRIVVGHHPVISSGYHGYFPRVEVRRMRALLPKLRESRVDLFIGGHDHHVELIRGRMLHLISGAGSTPVPPIKLRTTTVFPEEIRLERIGFAVVEITKREIRVRIYDGEGKARTGWIRGRKK
jgi:acid phosphatase